MNDLMFVVKHTAHFLLTQNVPVTFSLTGMIMDKYTPHQIPVTTPGRVLYYALHSIVIDGDIKQHVFSSGVVFGTSP